MHINDRWEIQLGFQLARCMDGTCINEPHLMFYTLSLQCLEEHKLMSIHGVSETQGISEDDFVRICPSLIRQLQKGACTEEKPGSSEVGEDTGKMSHGKRLNMAYVMFS